jgi:hypothetical protein
MPSIRSSRLSLNGQNGLRMAREFPNKPVLPGFFVGTAILKLIYIYTCVYIYIYIYIYIYCIYIYRVLFYLHINEAAALLESDCIQFSEILRPEGKRKQKKSKDKTSWVPPVPPRNGGFQAGEFPWGGTRPLGPLLPQARALYVQMSHVRSQPSNHSWKGRDWQKTIDQRKAGFIRISSASNSSKLSNHQGSGSSFVKIL